MMRWIVRLVALALVVGVGFLAVILIASQTGGEVVTLRTFRPDGLSQETSLWIVTDDGQLWVRAGRPGAGWLARLRENPDVQLVRDGVTHDYRAVVMERQRDRINRLMAEKYGLADRIIGVLGRDASKTTPIRLDPISP